MEQWLLSRLQRKAVCHGAAGTVQGSTGEPEPVATIQKLRANIPGPALLAFSLLEAEMMPSASVSSGQNSQRGPSCTDFCRVVHGNRSVFFCGVLGIKVWDVLRTWGQGLP